MHLLAKMGCTISAKIKALFNDTFSVTFLAINGPVIKLSPWVIPEPRCPPAIKKPTMIKAPIFTILVLYQFLFLHQYIREEIKTMQIPIHLWNATALPV